jgi:hypothetical protein
MKRRMTAEHPILDTIGRLNRLALHIPIKGDPAADGPWIAGPALSAPDDPPLRHVMEGLTRQGFGADRRAAAASFMLRFGWSSGYAIGAYMLHQRVPDLDGMALRFHERYMFLNGVRAGCHIFSALPGDRASAHPDCQPVDGPEALATSLFDELYRHAAPVVRALHAWSGFSERALWAMVTSSWSAQFANLGEALGREADALAQAQHLFHTAEATLRRALPEVYLVESQGRAGICHRRAACCLYFKAPGAHYCASCPLLPEPDRLVSIRHWIATRLRADAASALKKTAATH